MFWRNNSLLFLTYVAVSEENWRSFSGFVSELFCRRCYKVVLGFFWRNHECFFGVLCLFYEFWRSWSKVFKAVSEKSRKSCVRIFPGGILSGFFSDISDIFWSYVFVFMNLEGVDLKFSRLFWRKSWESCFVVILEELLFWRICSWCHNSLY